MAVATAAAVPAFRGGGGPAGPAGFLCTTVAGRRLGCHCTGELF